MIIASVKIVSILILLNVMVINGIAPIERLMKIRMSRRSVDIIGIDILQLNISI